MTRHLRRRRAPRTSILVTVGAGAAAMWLGLTAPSVSPVTPAPPPPAVVVVVNTVPSTSTPSTTAPSSTAPVRAAPPVTDVVAATP